MIFLLASFYVSLFISSILNGLHSDVLEQQSRQLQLHSPKKSRKLKSDEEARDSSVPGIEVSPLRAIDKEQYTVRVNTWKRPEQLELLLHHLLTCEAVAQIQVIWCIAQGIAPAWLYNMTPRVVVEEHKDNSLNARFDILEDTVTAGILTQDDDVMRPCAAIDAGFALWTLNPERMVGFDARSHNVTIDENGNEVWSYVGLSGSRKSNHYSLVLTRFAFLHRDYMTSYIKYMPNEIRETVSNHLNCEDIAMTMWVSTLTEGKTPLLADAWAVHTQMKMKSNTAISGTKDHKEIRSSCVDKFANILNLKQRLQTCEWGHKTGNNLAQWGVQGADPRKMSSISNHVAKMMMYRDRFTRFNHEEAGNEIQKMKMDVRKKIYEAIPSLP